MQSILSLYDESAFREYLRIASRFKQFDIDSMVETTFATIRYYRGDKNQRASLRSGQELEAKWYTSLQRNEPDYSVYNDTFFVGDVWACWVLYSRKYLQNLKTPIACQNSSLTELFRDAKSVADLGCGIGYTTAGLKELFPHASVYGTQLAGFQFDVATEIGKERQFRVCEKVESQTDLIFASEYFEHFQKPVEHLVDVIDVADPKYFIIASSFGSRSVGHFDWYIVDGVKILNRSVGRIFNQMLRRRGYVQIETGYWNNRPTVWQKQQI